MNDSKEHASMELEHFKQESIRARTEVFKKALHVIEGTHPVAIHMFGSGADGFKDEFSDIDLFTTVQDEKLQSSINGSESLYQQVAPILLKNTVLHKRPDDPACYYHDLVLFEYGDGIVHFENSYAPASTAQIPDNATYIWGDNSLPRHENALIEDAVYDDRSLNRQLSGLLAMSYVAVKGIVRDWDQGFFDWVKSIYDGYVKEAGLDFEPIPNKKSYALIIKMLENVKDEGDEGLQKANTKIREYAKKVEHLYK